MHFSRTFAAALLAGFTALGASAQGPSLQIEVNHPLHAVSPTLYGLMTEEINFSYDGGIYAEMVRDRTLGSDWQALAHWTMVSYGKSNVELSVDEHSGPSTAITRSLKVHVTEASSSAAAGVQNDGYWGMAVRPNTTYTGSFYAKSDTPDLPVTITFLNDQTGARSAVATVTGIGHDWKRYTFTLKTGNVPPSENNHLQFTVTKPATVWFDLVSLFPPTYKGTPNGNRIDLMEKLAAMHPAFLRLPGGNYLEGNSIPERFEWKKTIGPLVDRPTHMSPWGYRSSDGMGLLEYLEWCEDLHMQPVLAVYAGYSLGGQHVAPGPALEPYVQDALDEIEYVTGSTSTKWGAERAKDGHAAPFPLRYVEVGNEDFFDHSHTYDGRFAQFFKAIKAKYPELQVIATTPVKSVRPDVVDEHYYYSAEKSFSDAHHYDKADRSGPKIFVGEWATREGDPTPNLEAALGDAAWMTGLERNSDLIIMASYAPLFVNVNPGAMQWPTDLIGYDALHSYGSPSYYAQVMFSNYLGTEVVDSKLDDTGARLYSSVTRNDKTRTLYIKIVNATSEPQDFSINLDGVKSVKPHAKLITLSGKSPNATNSITDRTAVVPVDSQVSISGTRFKHTFPRYSINVLELSY